MIENIYEQKSLSKLIFTFSIPAILSLVIEISTSVVDTAFAGHIGVQSMDALTAMGLIAPLLAIFTALQTLFAISTAIMIARYLNHRAYLEQHYFTGIVLSVLISAVTSISCFIFLEPILLSLGATGSVLLLAEQYLRIQLISNVFSAVGYTLTGCIRAFGHPKAEAVIISIAVVVNIVFNALLTFGFSLGLSGIALGTLISEIVCAGMAYLWLKKKKLGFKWMKLSVTAFFSMGFAMFKIGIAQTIMQVLAGCTGFFINGSLAKFGTLAHIAAWNIVQKIYMLALMPIVGISQSVQTIIAYFSGHKKEAQRKKVTALTMLYCGIYGLILTILMLTFAEGVLQIFGAREEVNTISLQMMPFIFLTFPCVGILYTTMTVLQVTDRELACVGLALTRQVLAIVPLVLILPLIFTKVDLGLTPVMSIFLAVPLADILAIIVAMVMQKWQHVKT